MGLVLDRKDGLVSFKDMVRGDVGVIVAGEYEGLWDIVMCLGTGTTWSGLGENTLRVRLLEEGVRMRVG